MAITPRLDLRQSQNLAMTPRLQQAIRLLQMSALELETAVTEELEQNPFLEREGKTDGGDDVAAAPDDDSGYGELPALMDSTGQEEAPPDTNDVPTEDSFYEQADAPAETPDEPFDFSMDGWTGAGAAGYDGESVSAVDLCAAPRMSLHDWLASQINMAFRDENDRRAAFVLLERLDANGWLADAAPDILPPETAARILPVLQGFSPTGVFARNLAECLAIQLRENDRLDPAMAAMLEHLDLVAAREYKKLSKLCGVDGDDIADMVAEIRRLNPKPAGAYDAATPAAVIPDVLVRRGKTGDFIVELNQSVLPRVLINRTYAAEVARAAGKDKAAKKFLSQHLSAANWLVKALNQRAETVLKVASEIVERQREFFLNGERALKPMVLRDVAEAAGLHESTVSRVTAQKYLACARGVFELKYFFSQGLETRGGDDQVSAQAVRGRIRELIDAETPQNVLSDEDVVALLKRENIEIARRTVAKYREAMGIPTSARRKRDKRLKA